ncbi:MAG: hypothetical protein ACRECO_19965 [Xanthobacteraceae bacterium]
MRTLSRYVFVAVGVTIVAAASIAAAAQKGTQQKIRIRGTIEKIDGQMLDVKSREGANLKVKMADKVRLTAMVKASLADLKPDTYIGVTAMPQADGGQRAVAIHIFQPKQRGTGEGHRPWDLQPGSTMTNAAIETTVAGTDGQVITVRYKQGDKIDQKKVIVTARTVIVRYLPGDRKELKSGLRVMLNNATKNPDGTINAPTVSYGRDGVVPPM